MFSSSTETDTYRHKIINCVQHAYLVCFQSLKIEGFSLPVLTRHQIFNIANVNNTVG